MTRQPVLHIDPQPTSDLEHVNLATQVGYQLVMSGYGHRSAHQCAAAGPLPGGEAVVPLAEAALQARTGIATGTCAGQRLVAITSATKELMHQDPPPAWPCGWLLTGGCEHQRVHIYTLGSVQ